MACFIPGRLFISACLSSSMWAGLIMPGWGSERYCHKLFGTSVRTKCRRSPLLATCHHCCVIKVKGEGQAATNASARYSRVAQRATHQRASWVYGWEHQTHWYLCRLSANS